MNLLRGILPCCNEKRMLQKVKLFQYIIGMITSYLRKRKLFVQLLYYVNSSLPNNDIISSWCALWLLCQSSSWPTHSSSLRERLCIAFTNRPMLSRIYFEVQLETAISAMYFAYFCLSFFLDDSSDIYSAASCSCRLFLPLELQIRAVAVAHSCPVLPCAVDSINNLQTFFIDLTFEIRLFSYLLYHVAETV